jgi:hypothetical protein
MTDAKATDKDKPLQPVEKQSLKSPDAHIVQNANGQQFQAALKANLDQHSGSAGGNDAESVQIHMGDGRIASRLSAVTENQLFEPESIKNARSISLNELVEKQEKERDPIARSLVGEFEQLLAMRNGPAKKAVEEKWQDKADQTYGRGHYFLHERPASQAIEPMPPILDSLKQSPHDSDTKLNIQITPVPEVSKPIAEIRAQEGYQKFESCDSAAESKNDQVYLASNLTPKMPEIKPTSQWGKNEQLPDWQVTAQNYVYSSGLPTLVPSAEQLGVKPAIDATTQSAALQLEQKWNPFRGNIKTEMSKIPESAWHEAYEKFPQFKESGFSEKQATEVMQAIVRNELYNYDLADKEADDAASAGRTPLLAKLHFRQELNMTLGQAQVSTKGVHQREAEYPKQVNFRNHEEDALLRPENTPIIVAATLAHNIDMYQRHHIPITEESLAYSYNAPDKQHVLPTKSDLSSSKHVANVMHQVAIIRHQIEAKLDEN